MKLIAILGKKRSGKDTCANYIAELDSIKYQLAGPIKESLCDVYNDTFDVGYLKLTPEDFEGNGEFDRERALLMNNNDAMKYLKYTLAHLQKKYKLDASGSAWHQCHKLLETIVLNNTEAWTIRRFMQTLGTDLVVDCLDRMFWMKLFAEKYFDTMFSGTTYFVVPDVRQQHEIDALRAMGATIIHVVRPDVVYSTDTHITEAGLPIEPTDYVINNDSTVEELFEKLNKVITCQN